VASGFQVRKREVAAMIRLEHRYNQEQLEAEFQKLADGIEFLRDKIIELEKTNKTKAPERPLIVPSTAAIPERAPTKRKSTR
jgi:hypothetical protein